MQSSGGLMSAARAARQPAQIVESGPAGGVIAGVRLGEASGVRDLICLDMGGTTAKASVIEGGAPTLTNEYELGAGITLSSQMSQGRGYALKLPVLDIAEVGAGGGSIVTADPLGTILVGPHSAGAVPGPACYAAGGDRATVTDANVVLGFVNPDSIAGGTRAIHPHLAHRAIHDDVAAPLGLSVEDAAYGVFGVATATMARAVKAVTTYRGRDPRGLRPARVRWQRSDLRGRARRIARHATDPDPRRGRRLLRSRAARGRGDMAPQPVRLRGRRRDRPGRPGRHASATWRPACPGSSSRPGVRDAEICVGRGCPLRRAGLRPDDPGRRGRVCRRASSRARARPSTPRTCGPTGTPPRPTRSSWSTSA